MSTPTKARTGEKRDEARRDAIVNLRMPGRVRDLIDDAAAAVGKTRTDFIIESCRREATDVLLDKRLFTLGAADYDAFVAALDKAPAPNAKLKRLMARKAPWEKPAP
jgi:uncharacterized protein (DUF1778 family)